MEGINTIKKIGYTSQRYWSVIYLLVMCQMEGDRYYVQA